MSAWPFLFAAGKMLDYQFIVCPRPLAHRDRIGAFRRVVSLLVAEPTNSSRPVRVDDPSLQNILVYYLCQPATIGGKLVVDCGHRPVHVVTGVVFDRTDADNAEFESRAREMVTKQTLLLWPRFESFWNRLAAPPNAEISEPIGGGDASPPPTWLEHGWLWGIGHPAMATVSALVVIAGVAVGGTLFGYASNDRQSQPKATVTIADQMQPGEVRVTAIIGKKLNDLEGRNIGDIRDLIMDPDGNVAALLVDAPDGGQVFVDLHDGSTDKARPKLILAKELVQLNEDRPVKLVRKAESANPSGETDLVQGVPHSASKD
jgi:hypothetical protein